MNGAHRPDLDGAFDITLEITPFTYALPIRRLPLGVAQAAEIRSLRIDVETLGVVTVEQTVERAGPQRWRITTDGDTVEFDVDDYGLPMDVEGRFLRAS